MAPSFIFAAMSVFKPIDFDNRYARLGEPYASRVMATPVPVPYVVSVNPDALELLDLTEEDARHPEFVEYFSGNRTLPGSEPVAALYAGHQFGHYVSQLGDGRALLLGEARNGRGEGWEVQLKGAGKTPYSRGGDGRAVLRSSIREYLCSEAMHGLGIPTTRALCIVGTDMPVYREEDETGAIVTRLAQSFLRFGSFEVFFYRDQRETLKALADFALARYFPEQRETPDPYGALLQEVVRRTARLMAQWQAVGFSHGVMNTDNMSLLGLTLDYGPYGFMDAFDPGFVCNHSDSFGRYAFDQQPDVGGWNLACLAQALSPLLEADAAQAALRTYAQSFNDAYVQLMATKIGLDADAETADLLAGLLRLLAQNRVDYTNFFRRLGSFDSSPDALNTPLRDLFLDRPAFDAWATRYAAVLRTRHSTDAVRRAAMARANPKYVLRNHLAEIAIHKARDERDYTEIERLRALLSRPYDEQPRFEAYAAEPPDWAQHIEVSCSS